MDFSHLDLFAGIGGFSLAARWTGWQTIGFSEIDPYCCKVLEKNFPGVKNYGDIKTLDGRTITADLITGGFPCQPFSIAGRQRGQDDKRYLWPEMLRVIAECQPTWVCGENVPGLISLALERVCTDLESLGFEVQSLVIPACAVNAPHRRERVWILAYHPGNGCRQGRQGRLNTGSEGEREQTLSALTNGSSQQIRLTGQSRERGSLGAIVANSQSNGLQGPTGQDGQSDGRGSESSRVDTPGSGKALADAPSNLRRSSGDDLLPSSDGSSNATTYSPEPGLQTIQRQYSSAESSRWSEFAPETWRLTQPAIRRRDDGVPRGMDRDRLKALGNAIVPQLAAVLLAAIREGSLRAVARTLPLIR